MAPVLLAFTWDSSPCVTCLHMGQWSLSYLPSHGTVVPELLAFTLDSGPSAALVRERTVPSERPPHVGEVNDNFADIGCGVVSAAGSYGRILGFLDRG
jgi:hypothetical protein